MIYLSMFLCIYRSIDLSIYIILHTHKKTHTQERASETLSDDKATRHEVLVKQVK